MDSPKDFFNNNAGDNLYFPFKGDLPSPLNIPEVDHPLPHVADVGPIPDEPNNNVENNGTEESYPDFTFEIDIDEIMNFDAEDDLNVDPEPELTIPTVDLLSDVGPPITMETPSNAGPQTVMDTPSNAGGPTAMDTPSNAGYEGLEPLAFESVPHGALDCTACIVASELYDSSNGLYHMGVALHVVNGVLDHLVFEAVTSDHDVNIGRDTFILNFEGQNLEQINSALADYAIQIDENGFIILHDSFIAIYNLILQRQADDEGSMSSSESAEEYATDDAGTKDPLVMDFFFDINRAYLDIPERVEGPSSAAGNADTDQNNRDWKEGPGEPSGTAGNVDADRNILDWEEGPGEPSGTAGNADAVRNNPILPAVAPRNRPSVGAQRERTANMTIETLVPFFHMKAEEAARRLEICPTTLKIVCRKLRVGRWPHRKLKSINNRIKKLRKLLEQKLAEQDADAVASLEAEIAREEEDRRRLYEYLTRPR